MPLNLPTTRAAERAQRIRVEGLVQGVGFRPVVWRLAHSHGLRGSVCNDGRGVEIHVCGTDAAMDQFVLALHAEAPPLSRIERVVRREAEPVPCDAGFAILPSVHGAMHTGVAPDAAACDACMAEVFDPSARRYRYPFTNCTHCGPRLSIVQRMPYDRNHTTMRGFSLCAACRDEYEDPADRRFHAQPIACPDCGPRAWLAAADGTELAPSAWHAHDAPDAVRGLLDRGAIVAIKGLGGFQLACDATDASVVARLRERKQRDGKPFALMARDMEMVRRYCIVSREEEQLLRSAAAPIVLLDRRADGADLPPISDDVAPGLRTLGFMLPNTPLHHLVLQQMAHPIVLTSGNLSGEPQQVDNAQALARLGVMADYFLLHDRAVERRIDDSVLRVAAGTPRMLRRARGLAPAPIVLPRGFDAAPPVLALGGELKNTFCLLRDGQAVLSHHIGDLENAPTHADYRRAIDDYRRLFAFAGSSIAIDLHPEYLSSKLGRDLAAQALDDPQLAQVQHHHAHIAACLADNGVALDAAPVIGVALDGLGLGENGQWWGGEFFEVSYRSCTRLARFKPVAMLGAQQAMREPWRNTYAHLLAGIGWPRFASSYGQLELFRRLDAKPRALLDSMLRGQVNSPLASSCGRLFDAVAAACGVCFERAGHEAQAAIAFEALADPHTLHDESDALAYTFGIQQLPHDKLPYIEPQPMWQAVLDDLLLHTPVGVISARFHKGLAIAVTHMVGIVSRSVSPDARIRTVALSGGVFQNTILLEQVVTRLQNAGFSVLTHRQVPANDGGLSLGQAVVAAARALDRQRHGQEKRSAACV